MTRLVDIVQGPWAITPPMLEEIVGIYSRHMRGEKIDIPSVEARLGRPLRNDRQAYQVLNGVAVIDVHGVMAKRANLFMDISGGVSSQMLGNDLRAALADPEVQSILLDIDSPGGTVDGTQELASLVRSIDEQKPVVAFVNGMACSAAYWLASAAQQVFLSSRDTYVGSIGVVAVHWDVSKADEKYGFKRTEITAGKYKRIASDTGPLTPEGRDYIQAQLDIHYSNFLEAVADNRGVSVERVLADMADGRVFIGQDGVTAGLADAVASFDEVMAFLASGEIKPGIRKNAQSAGVREQANHPKENHMTTTLTLEAVREGHPDIAAALEKTGFDKGLEAGAAAERKRIQDVEAACLPGHEKLIASLKFDGKTTGPEAAMAIVGAERAARGSTLATLKADAAPPVPAAAAADDAKPDPSTLPVEQRAKVEWDSDPKVRALFGDNFQDFMACRKAEDAGLVRVLTGKRA